MADNYGQWFITKMFTDAEAAAVTSGKQITFKKMIASQDIFTQDDLATLTNSVLGTIDIKQQVNISTVLPSTGSYKVQGVFSNSTVSADYLMNTILLVGSYNGAEFLAAAQVANNAFKMPAASTGEQTIYTIAAQISVSNTAAVSLTVDPDSIVTNAGLKVVTDAQAAKDSAQDVKISDFEVKDSQNVKITGNQTIDGAKTYTQKITGSISGNAGTATKLETTRKIDGKDFDGSQDIVLDVVHKTGDETIAGTKTFTSPILGSAAVDVTTVTTGLGANFSSGTIHIIKILNLCIIQVINLMPAKDNLSMNSLPIITNANIPKPKRETRGVAGLVDGKVNSGVLFVLDNNGSQQLNINTAVASGTGDSWSGTLIYDF